MSESQPQTMPRSAYRNTHGRKPGRGIRPYLLMPKVIAVAAYFGGLLAAVVVWFAPWLELSLLDRVAVIRTLFITLVVPSLLVCVTLGVLLWMQHPHLFIRMRWWQAKMLLLAAGVPVAHVYMSGKLDAVRHGELHARGEFGSGLLILVAGSVCIIWLARHKPRLWQNWARAHAQAMGKTPVK